ncbi:putative oxalocrotonate tautomerase [Halenospora varia]|nr:putative oxalocrotonate tautomerase [Halenospora varia]
MPKWSFTYTTRSFTAEDKERITKGRTELYTSVGIPVFYCHTNFFELPAESIYAGGERQAALTLLSIQHIARSFDTPEIKDFFFSTLDKILRPILKPKGIEWELGIIESSRNYWRVHGLVPPQTGSDLKKKWFAANKVTDEEEMAHEQGFIE